MELGGKKYEILPGTAVPNMKDILAAASDFSTPGVENLQIKGEHNTNGGKSYSLDDVINDLHTMNEEDLKKLQALGDEVSESEARAQEESRRKMEAIKNSAVIAPESLSQLRERAATEVSDEKKAEIEKLRQEQEAKEAEERAKAKAREERRQMQRQAMLDSRAKAEEDAQNAADSETTVEDKEVDTENDATIESEATNNTEAVNVVDESINLVDESSNLEPANNESTEVAPNNSAVSTASTASDTDTNTDNGDDILSSDDTLDDFSEFL